MAARTAKLIKLVLLLGISGVFLAAGVSKALDPARFATAIFHYKIFPWGASAALSLYLPYLEMTAAVSLWFQTTRRSALLVLLVLSVLFTGALISAAIRDLDVTCGCFGAVSESSPGAAIIRNCLLITVIIFLLASNRCRLLKSGTTQAT